MTKSEVRAVSLSKLEIQPDDVIYDIGAGTGSVSVEAALAAVEGHVYAFEQKEEGCQLIQANAEKHHVVNITVVPGKAPASMQDCPAPDRVFIGGSGGNLEELLNLMFSMNPKVRIVMNVIALETLNRVMEYLKQNQLQHELVLVQVSRAEVRAGYHMMQGQNPVYVITMEQKAEYDVVEQNAEKYNVKQVNMPRILLAAPSSGSGKTVLTTGLLALMKRRGHHPVSFKCGPDYIDPMFHRYVLDVPGCNLDSFFLDPEQVRSLLAEKMQQADIGIIEGVMGYYDGIAGNTTGASTYEIADITKTPVILVLDGKKSSLSLAALLKGFLTYKKDSHIVGVILNRTSPVMLERLRPLLEELGVRCLGAVPVCEEAKLESRHLGLTIPQEQKELREKIEAFADRLAECLDLDEIERIAAQAPGLSLDSYQNESEPFVSLDGSDSPDASVLPDGSMLPDASILQDLSSTTEYHHRMGIAQDEAFCFYYQENLDFLRGLGWELIPFSPLHDAKLPDRLDGILLGGGYPEVYAKQLSENSSMCLEIRQAAAGGMKILAECGGFLYLHDRLEGTDGIFYPMVGVIHGDGFRTKRLSRFGYITLKPSGIRGHEFHYWDSTNPGSDQKAEKPGTSRGWDCMQISETMIAGFPHLYYRSAPDWIRSFLELKSN